MKALIFALLLITPAFSQTAKVIALSPEDAKQAKALADEQAALDKRKADFEKVVTAKYLTEDAPKSVSGYSAESGWAYYPSSKVTKAGWTGGFEYSDDYKFIVPTPSKPYQSPMAGCIYGM